MFPASLPTRPAIARLGAASASACGPGEWEVHARLRVHVIVAGHQPPDAELAEVVGLRRTRRREAAFTLLVLITKHADQDARHRVAGLVVHVAGDDAAARQAELDVLDLLTVGELERCAGLQRPSLAVRERDESGL